jgi:hypothetical protein
MVGNEELAGFSERQTDRSAARFPFRSETCAKVLRLAVRKAFGERTFDFILSTLPEKRKSIR